MSDFSGGSFDLNEMSEDEKDDLILQISEEYNQAITIGVSLHNSLVVLAARLSDGDVLGKRGPYMRDVAHRMATIAAMAMPHLVTEEGYERMTTDAAFSEIVENLDLDSNAD